MCITFTWKIQKKIVLTENLLLLYVIPTYKQINQYYLYFISKICRSRKMEMKLFSKKEICIVKVLSSIWKFFRKIIANGGRFRKYLGK